MIVPAIIKTLTNFLTVGFKDDLNTNFYNLQQKDVEISNRVETILQETDLDPNKDPEVTDSRISEAKVKTFGLLGDRIEEMEVDYLNHINEYAGEELVGHIGIATADEIALGTNETKAITPLGVKPISDAAYYYGAADEGLARLDYWNAEEIRVYKKNFTCKGFRYHGSSYKRFGKSVDIDPLLTYPKVNFKSGYIETGYTFNQWYAVFGVIKPGEMYGSLVPVPFLRVHSISGNEITFAECGFNGNIATIKNYNFKNLAGYDVLIIHENANFSGLVKNIVSNTPSKITLDNIPASLTAGDYILPAPQLDDYVYLGSFYVDTAEIFNRGEFGNGIIYYRGVSISGLSIAGNISAGVDIDFRTFVSPLATGVYFYVYNTFSTSATGTDSITFGLDASHDIDYKRYEKPTTASDAYRHYSLMPFMMKQRINIKSAGLGNSATDRTINIRGYVEK